MRRWLYIVLLLGLTVQAGAARKLIGPNTTDIEDAGIKNDQVDKNYGASVNFYLAANYPVLIRCLHVSDSLPDNITITSCTLYVQVRTVSTNGNADAFRVFKPWVEGANNGTDPANDGSVTWNDWSNDNFEWGTAGCENKSDAGADNSGDGSGYDRKTTYESEVNLNALGWFGFAISTALAQGWYDNTILENGIILKGVSTTYQQIHLSETGVSSNGPYFAFNYTENSTVAPSAGQVIRVIEE